MRVRVIALDFDETLAHDGVVEASVQRSLVAVRNSGRKLILITGRELRSLHTTNVSLETFELVVAENGAVIYHPATQQERDLCGPPSPVLVKRLQQDGVNPLSIGRCIIATLTAFETKVQTAIRELGLDLQIILNRDSVMVLPTEVDKGSGLVAALHCLRLPAEECMGIGDAENDSAFLSRCGFSVAVRNAIPSLKQWVHLVTEHENGAGVVETLERVLANGSGDDLLGASVNDGGSSLRC